MSGEGGRMALSKADQVKRAQAKCDAIMLRPKKEDGRRIREAALKAGLPLQRYIIQAVEEKIERDAP